MMFKPPIPRGLKPKSHGHGGVVPPQRWALEIPSVHSIWC